MRYLESFVQEYHEHYNQKEEIFEDTISGKIKKLRSVLLNEEFLPSLSLKNLFDKLLRRAQYPMEVAITGQFSSGKSTFLNALLSKDILPTGITPVTSKVNFINYASEYKLRVTFMNGAQEYHNIENIASFTDQREEGIEDIKYLSIYAPMNILKEISFVDTPGLNSQSLRDTQTTQKVLRDVDGIIWLSLIDNAGKESEANVLKEYMQHFKDKSLCVLNQKDKFTQEEVDKTSAYVRLKFDNFFQKVIPISAKQALESRSQQKEVLIKEAMHDISSEFKNALCGTEQNLDFFKDTFSEYEQKVQRIMQKDRSYDIQELHDSNIQEALDFINDVIRPAALESKSFALKKELISICDILINEYKSILGVYKSLNEVIGLKQDELLEAFDAITNTRQKELSAIYEEVNDILVEVAHEIFIHIKRDKKERFQEKESSFFKRSRIEKFEYESFCIDSESVYKNLFYEDQRIDKKFIKIQKRLKRSELLISESFKEVYGLLESSVHTWQEPYELISKHREIASDLEFAKTRHFASKVFENILIDYHNAIEGNIVAFKKKFAYLNGALTLSYKSLIQASLLHFETSFSAQVLSYEKDPQHVSLTMPYEEDIYRRLRSDFSMDKVQSYLNSRRNYLYKIVAYAKEEYVQINEKKCFYISSKEKVYEEKIKKLELAKDDVSN